LAPLKKTPAKNVDISKWENEKIELEKKIVALPAPLSVKEDTLKDRKERLLAQRKKL